jgi:hypothetical protein
MQSGWSQLTQKTDEFLTDMHIVTGNFFGNQDWKWVHDDAANREKAAPGAWQRFKMEMMQDTKHYTSDSSAEDRATVGVIAGLWGLPYFIGRVLFCDWVLNTLEFTTWRVTESVCAPDSPKRTWSPFANDSPMHPNNR